MLAFDDFGTGYASLSYLTASAGADQDRPQLWPRSPDDTATPHRALADRDGAQPRSRVIAEGVETRAQAEFLLKEHCRRRRAFSMPAAATAESSSAAQPARGRPERVSEKARQPFAEISAARRQASGRRHYS